MKTPLSLIGLLLAGVFLFSACGESAKQQEAQTGEAEEASAVEGTEVKIDAAASSVGWAAYKVAGSGHNGTVAIKDGKFIMNGEELVGGSFSIDLTAIGNEDIEDAEEKQKLIGHLNSGDFFLTEKHPTADFEITGIEENASDSATHTITGNLTMRGKTNSITFPATVSMENGQLKATANFALDRTKWDVSFHSGLEEWGDKTIKDEFDVMLDIRSM